MQRFTLTILLLFLGGPLFGQPASAFPAAIADANGLPLDVRIQTRYVDFGQMSAEQRALYVRTWRGHANQLSRAADLNYFRRVTESLYAVVLEDFDWKAETWEKLAEIEPYYHEQAAVIVERVKVRKVWPGGKDSRGDFYPAGTPWDTFEIKTVIRAVHNKAARKWGADTLAVLVNSNAPLVDGAWLFAQTARQVSLRNKQTGAGYYDFLRIKDRKQFEDLIQVDKNKSIAFGREMRAVMAQSGVASEGRQIERYQGLGGGAWRTLDSDDSSDKSNPIRLLGRDEYQHKAEEHYGQLANGFFAFFLCDNKGARQDSAPDFIGPDDSPLRHGRDARIHVGLACIRCHVDGLRPVDDWVRRTAKDPIGIQTPDYKKYLELKRAFFTNLDKQLERDRQTYVDALKEATDWAPQEFAKAFAECWDYYALRQRGAAEIAEQMGIKQEALVQALKAEAKRSGKLDLVLSGLLQAPPVPLRVEHLEELMPELWRIVGY